MHIIVDIKMYYYLLIRWLINNPSIQVAFEGKKKSHVLTALKDSFKKFLGELKRSKCRPRSPFV